MSDFHVLFWDFGVILEKNRKSAKTEKSGHYRAPTLQRREPTPRRRPTARLGIPSPRRGRCAKMALLGYTTGQHCCVAAYLQFTARNFFGFLFRSTSYSYTNSLRTLIND